MCVVVKKSFGDEYDDHDDDYDYDWIVVLFSDIWMYFLFLRYENSGDNRK